MKTITPKKEDIKKKWYVVDAEGKVLGRLCTKIAHVVRGKHKPTFTPHMDTGDNVIVINADKIVLTGNKMKDKIYYHHTGHPGGIKSITASDMLKKKPGKVVQLAVQGMLPKNKLGRKLLDNVKIYSGAEHPHVSQKPETLAL